MIISNFKEVIDFYKRLKAPLVTTNMVNPNMAIGGYDKMRVIRTMEFMEPCPFLKGEDWLNFELAHSKDLDITGPVPSEFLPEINGPMVHDGLIPILNVNVHRELNGKLAIVYNMLETYEKRYSDIVFNEGEFFDTFSAMKASDGAIMCRVSPSICFSVYKGLIPFLKTDTVTYSIYCGPKDFVVEFITRKKKASEPSLKTYIRYMYV